MRLVSSSSGVMVDIVVKTSEAVWTGGRNEGARMTCEEGTLAEVPCEVPFLTPLSPAAALSRRWCSFR
jgi:hypothetical protein